VLAAWPENKSALRALRYTWQDFWGGLGVDHQMIHTFQKDGRFFRTHPHTPHPTQGSRRSPWAVAGRPCGIKSKKNYTRPRLPSRRLSGPDSSMSDIFLISILLRHQRFRLPAVRYHASRSRCIFGPAGTAAGSPGRRAASPGWWRIVGKRLLKGGPSPRKPIASLPLPSSLCRPWQSSSLFVRPFPGRRPAARQSRGRPGPSL